MKMRVARQEFLEVLSAAAAVAGGRTTKPIFGCVRVAAGVESVELSATDGEVALRLGVSALLVERPGQAVVSAERLLGIVRELPDAEIYVEADERYCVVCGEGSEFKVFLRPTADFPVIPVFEDEPDLVLDGGCLRRMVGLTIYAAARETGRYAINGILWQKRGRRLFLVATDGRRLARAGATVLEAKSADFDVIVPAKALGVFERVFAPGRERGEWAVDVRVMPNQVALRSGEHMLSTVLIEGNFPNYDDVIPKDTDKRARVDRLELYGAIRRAALLTSDEARAVKLAFAGERLIITAHSAEEGEARVEIPLEYDGEPLDIAFNPAFMSDALKAFPGDTVQIELKESFRPGIICGEDQSDFLYVVMPVSL